MRYRTATKSFRLEQLLPEAWEPILGGARVLKADALYAAVAWEYRCVNIIANQVAAMPYDILKKANADIVTSSNDSIFPKDLQFLLALPKNNSLAVASAQMSGQAYWTKTENVLGDTLLYHYLQPHTVTPQWTKDGELLAFKRSANGKHVVIQPEDMVWFWPPDYTTEQGPAKVYPGKVALAAAGIIASMQDYKTGYFDRGLVRPTFIKFGEPITIDEAERTKSQFRRAFAGVKNAFTQYMIREDITLETIGDKMSDIGDRALTDEEREDIAVAFGVPQSKVVTKSSSLSSDTRGDDARFIEDTIKPILAMLQSSLNAQVFDQLGYSIKFKPDSLPVMQEDEAKRADSLQKLTSAGVPLGNAMIILGYDEEMIPEVIQPEPVQEPKQPPPPPVDSNQLVENEIRSLRNWCKNRKAPLPKNFKSDVLSFDEIAAIVSEYNPAVTTHNEATLRHTELLAQMHEAIVQVSATPEPPQPQPINFTISPPNIDVSIEPQEVKNHIVIPEHPAPNVTVTTPEHPAPNVVVNVEPSTAAVVVNNDIQLPQTVTEEIVVKRGQSGLISGATSVSTFNED